MSAGSGAGINSAILDIVIPTVVAIGTGLITYALTGGEEEYPPGAQAALTQQESSGDPTSQDGEDDTAENDDSSLHAVLAKFCDDVQSLEERVSDIDRKLDSIQTTPPAWAAEILQRMRQISDDVQILKSSQRIDGMSAASPLPYDGSTTESRGLSGKDAQSLASVEALKKAIDVAAYALQHGLDDSFNVEIFDAMMEKESDSKAAAASGTASKSLQSACDLLSMFVKNIIKFPDIPRYRKVSTTNANYKTILAPVTGHARMLAALGFTAKSGHWEFEWDLTGDKDSKQTIAGSTRTPDMTLEVLNYGVEVVKALKEGTFSLRKLAIAATPPQELQQMDASAHEGGKEAAEELSEIAAAAASESTALAQGGMLESAVKSSTAAASAGLPLG